MGQTKKMTLHFNASDFVRILALIVHLKATAWLSVASAQNFLGEQAPIIAVTPHNMVPAPGPFSNSLSYALEFDAGLPGNVLNKLSIDYGISSQYHLSNRIDAGLYLRRNSTTGTDTVLFDTGYTEVRDYSIGVWQAGASGRLRLSEAIFAFGRVGLSLTSATLSKISTDAPEDPSLSVGYSKSIPVGIAAAGGLSYEFKWPRYAISLDSGYSVTSVLRQESLTEIYGGITIRVYHESWVFPDLTNLPAAQEVPVSAPVTAPAPAPAPVPAPAPEKPR